MGQTREGAGGPCQGAELPKHGGFAQGPGSFPCGSVGSALGQWVLGAGAHGVGILVRFGVMVVSQQPFLVHGAPLDVLLMPWQ